MQTLVSHHVFAWFPLGKLEEFTWFPLKENVLVRSGFIGETCSLRHKHKWKTTLKSLVSKGKNEGKYKEILITQSTHKGNHMETQGFPHVSLRYETSALWVLDFPDGETQRNFRYPTMKSVGKHKETPGFCKFPKDRKLLCSSSQDFLAWKLWETSCYLTNWK